MPRTRGEGNKKHGDELQSLIERTGGDPWPGERKESADDDESELVPDDEDRALLEDEDEDEDEDEVDEEDLDDDFESHDPD